MVCVYGWLIRASKALLTFWTLALLCHFSHSFLTPVVIEIPTPQTLWLLSFFPLRIDSTFGSSLFLEGEDKTFDPLLNKISHSYEHRYIVPYTRVDILYDVLPHRLRLMCSLLLNLCCSWLEAGRVCVLKTDHVQISSIFFQRKI